MVFVEQKPEGRPACSPKQHLNCWSAHTHVSFQLGEGNNILA